MESLLASISFTTSFALIADPLSSRPDPGPDFVLLLLLSCRMVVVNCLPGRHHRTRHGRERLRHASSLHTA